MGVGVGRVATAATFALVLIVGACSSADPDTAADGDDAVDEPTVPTLSIPHGMGPPPTAEDGSVPPTVLLPQSPLGPWSLDVRASPGFPTAGGTPAGLVALRTGAGEGTQRIVFEFDGDVAPGWQVGMEPLPVRQDPTGEPVTLSGTAALVVRMTPASTVNLADGSFAPIYSGARRLGIDGPGPAQELVLTGDFEGLMTWVVGLDAQVPFAVDTLRSPARLVIDLLAVDT